MKIRQQYLVVISLCNITVWIKDTP